MDTHRNRGITIKDLVDIISLDLLLQESCKLLLQDKLGALDINEFAWFMDDDQFAIPMEEECLEESQHKTKNDITGIVTALKQTPEVRVQFPDIQSVYEKVQSRAGGGSSQRIAGGEVTISAVSQGQICGLEVYVQRPAKAAALSGSKPTMVPLEVTHQAHLQNQQTFSVDLDSVYNDANGEPVYKLATVDIEKRNIFVLIVYVMFVDGRKSEPFQSKPFLIRSRKPGSHRKDSM